MCGILSLKAFQSHTVAGILIFDLFLELFHPACTKISETRVWSKNVPKRENRDFRDFSRFSNCSSSATAGRISMKHAPNESPGCVESIWIRIRSIPCISRREIGDRSRWHFSRKFRRSRWGGREPPKKQANFDFWYFSNFYEKFQSDVTSQILNGFEWNMHQMKA